MKKGKRRGGKGKKEEGKEGGVGDGKSKKKERKKERKKECVCAARVPDSQQPCVCVEPGPGHACVRVPVSCVCA